MREVFKLISRIATSNGQVMLYLPDELLRNDGTYVANMCALSML